MTIPMSAESFRMAMGALYGDGGQAELSRALNCSRRTIWRYAQGERPIPDKTRDEVITLCRSRAAILLHLVTSLTAGKYPENPTPEAPGKRKTARRSARAAPQ